MTTINKENLEKLIEQLEIFVDPNNKDGFFSHFCMWVLKTWRDSSFFETEVVDSGYDVSTTARRTNEKMCEAASHYRDFINSANGNTSATYCSGSGLQADTLEDDLQEVYGAACSGLIDDFIEKHGLVLCKKDKNKDIQTVQDAIWWEAFDDETMRKLGDDIIMRFGVLGYEIEPYTCPYVGPGEIDDKKFGNWTIADFKKELVR